MWQYSHEQLFDTSINEGASGPASLLRYGPLSLIKDWYISSCMARDAATDVPPLAQWSRRSQTESL
jgi:hypothetical protein